MKITVIGTGYVGLVAGTCFSHIGIDVMCLDVDASKIDLLNKGGIPIYEPGLEALVQAGREARRLCFTTSYDEAVAHGEIFFIAVGTPQGEDGSADLQYVLEVASQIGRRITRPSIIVNKSTVPVGTADKVRMVVEAELEHRKAKVEFAVVSNPEFLREGVAIRDFMEPDRIVIGGVEPWAIEKMRRVYAPLNQDRDNIMVMDTQSAELTKYAANAMLATRISFMNELAGLSARLGADVEAVRRGIGSDPRIGPHFLFPGCGYGGSCFPKDVRALIRMAEESGVKFSILESTEQANERQKRVLFEMLSSFYEAKGGLKGRTVAVWGIAFKPNTDDVREAPSRVLVEQLLDAGARVRAYDPAASEQAERLFGNREGFSICRTAEAATEGSDVLAIVTEWAEFRNLSFTALAEALKDRAIFDGRNLYRPEEVEAAGLNYFQIGRQPPSDRPRVAVNSGI